MAEARSAVAQPRVDLDEDAKYPSRDVFRVWRRILIKRFFRTRNLIYNGLWPTSAWNLGILMVGLLTLLLAQDSHTSLPSSFLWRLADYLNLPTDLNYGLSELILALIVGVFFFIVQLYFRRYLLRLLLSYRGWMYEMPRSQGLQTKSWGMLVRLVSGHSPLLYNCQQSLPRLPVPALNDTLDKFIKSIIPLYGEDSDKVRDLREQAKKFAQFPGPKLQQILVLKSWWTPNWVTDWWEKYIYLMGRNPLAINSNYYTLDHSVWKPTEKQVVRAAATLHEFMVFKQKLDREEIKPLLIRNTIPICMSQYERLFATTRIPGEEIDTLVHTESSKHIAILRRGLIYKLNMYDIDGKLLSAASLQKQLEWIIDHADQHQNSYSEAAKSIPAFTGIERKTWAKVRETFFSDGINKESLQTIETAIFFVTLETISAETIMERACYLMQGDGRSLWFDKSLNVIYFANGRMGLNCEHSYADAPVVGHCQEYVMTNEAMYPLYKDGELVDADPNFKQGKLKPPSLLQWDFPDSFNPEVKTACSISQKNLENIDLCVRVHNAFGKGFIKTAKVSPDAFIQSALQLTYYTYYGKLALTYESSMTRLYLLGRTETVRSLTSELASFVRAMYNNKVTKQEKISLLQRSCTIHQGLYRDAMNGKGLDRHLFGLYVLSKGMGYDCDFLKDALLMPWTLSTSQQPQQQIASSPQCDLPQFDSMLGPGGGFGPVSDDGYGISYMVAGNRKIFFHISSKRSAKETDSSKFMDLLFQSMDDMKKLFDP
ncbi:carnitine O-palmitoyltransferase 1, liver isoform [Octopus bimaculoides]|uniref:carnitine O-palmitoyltransferase 1, liver isoform n=1 Tax=Octopus bimaculoides TaxID=37653 RepID=UPI0022E4188D|nr:carnitine O-palmitoyltransferase 1, liver isoform [Octopus bimaculoides]